MRSMTDEGESLTVMLLPHPTLADAGATFSQGRRKESKAYVEA